MLSMRFPTQRDIPESGGVRERKRLCVFMYRVSQQ